MLPLYERKTFSVQLQRLFIKSKKNWELYQDISLSYSNCISWEQQFHKRRKLIKSAANIYSTCIFDRKTESLSRHFSQLFQFVSAESSNSTKGENQSNQQRTFIARAFLIEKLRVYQDISLSYSNCISWEQQFHKRRKTIKSAANLYSTCIFDRKTESHIKTFLSVIPIVSAESSNSTKGEKQSNQQRTFIARASFWSKNWESYQDILSVIPIVSAESSNSTKGEKQSNQQRTFIARASFWSKTESHIKTFLSVIPIVSAESSNSTKGEKQSNQQRTFIARASFWSKNWESYQNISLSYSNLYQLRGAIPQKEKKHQISSEACIVDVLIINATWRLPILTSRQ